MISYVIYLLGGETAKISRVAFSYSRLYTEIIITGVVIANPNGAYKTPFFLTLDRLEVHLPISAICMTFVRSLWHEDGKLEGLIRIPYLMVNEVQIFFEKPEQGEAPNESTGTAPHPPLLTFLTLLYTPQHTSTLLNTPRTPHHLIRQRRARREWTTPTTTSTR
jgi:hypothetical protein